MGSGVAVVTDSTACLPADLIADAAVTVVPLQVVVDGRSHAEGVAITGSQVAEALTAHRQVTTSRPSPQAFADTYRALVAGGASELVSVHLSGDLSGTVEAARTAAREVAEEGVQARVVDSRSLGMGLGYAVLAAAATARGGGIAAEVAERAARVAMASATYVYVDTLEYLRRGGRIRAAQAAVGSALAVKPLLHLVDGRLEPLERVRTSSRALERLEEVVAAEAGDREVDLAVHHLAAEEAAGQVAERLQQRLPRSRRMVLSEVGAVVGAHVGPGMVAVVVSPVD
jgi:DegV family protein with EDD domain